MRRQLAKYRTTFAAIVGLFAVAAVVAGVILTNQRFQAPAWVPGIGTDDVTYTAELATAQSLTPGQGQTVDIAGISVGEISDVRLEDGRAVVQFVLRKRHAEVFRDASILVRPKTGLNDMTLQLDPGTRAAGELDPDDGRIPIAATLPNVNFDEVLAGLDGDTRQFLQLLLAGGADGLGGNGKALSAALRRFEPTGRDARAITEQLAERRTNIRRAVTRFRQLAEAVGDKDRELTRFVDSSQAVLQAFARQDAAIRASLEEAPATLRATTKALTAAGTLGTVLKPAAEGLQPAAEALAPTLRATRPFLRRTTPVIEDQLRPFSRDALPTVRALRPAARDLARIAPDLLESLRVVNYALNTLAHNPEGKEEGYLFWASWANHLGATLFGGQDAHGPIRRGLLLAGCSGLTTLDQLKQANPQLGVLIELSNFVRTSEACAQSSQAQGGTAP